MGLIVSFSEIRLHSLAVMDKIDHKFCDLQKTLDSLSSDLHRQGVGAVKHTAKVVDPKHEDIFRQKGLLGCSTPKVLQHTVFFYTGLHLFLGVYRSNTTSYHCNLLGNLKIGVSTIHLSTMNT